MSLTGQQLSIIERLFGPQHVAPASTGAPLNPPKTPYITSVLDQARTRNNINQLRNATPQHVKNVSAKATVGSNNTQVRVTFNRNSDPHYIKTNIYAAGYKGSTSPVLVASGDSPVTFTLDNTGENVVLRVVASGNSGEAAISNAPSAGVALRKSTLGGYGPTSTVAPSNLDQIADGTSYARPIISRINAGRPVIDFSEGIHSNKILDNVADGTTYARPLSSRLSAGKPLIDFSEGIHLNKTIDNVGDGSTYIRSTQLIGDAVLDNGNFEASSVLPPPGYEYYANVPTLAYDTTTPFSGTKSIKITSPSAGGGGIRPIKHILCRPGDTIYASAQAKWISGAGVADLSISFRDVTGAGLSGADATTGSSSWTHLTASATAPAGTAFVTLEVFASLANTVVEFDEHYVRMVRNLDTEVTDGTTRFAQTAGGLTYRPTSNPLTSTDAGSNATVSIAGFTMRCTGHSDVSISSGSITALSYGTLYYVYYDDATLAGGGVTFNATTTKETAINGSGRFFVGSIITPVASGAATVGNNDGGVGAQGGGTSVFLFGASTTVNNEPATFTVTNPSNCFDGSTSSFGKIVKAALTSSSSANVTVSAMSPTSAPWQSLTLKIKSAVPTNSGTSNTVSVSYSLDNGGTFTNIFSITGTRAVTVDSVALPVSQNLALVRVRMTISSSAAIQACEVDLYEAWVTGVL